jgi:transposase InsO family protein
MGAEAREAALSLRRKGLSLDECLEALGTLYPKVSRSGLHRLFQRHGLSRLSRLDPGPGRGKGAFKLYEPGFLHVDLTYLPGIGGERRYLFVAIDRATRLVFVQIRKRKTKREAHAFLEAALEFFPFRIHRLLTDNGSEFTHRFWKRRPGGTKLPHPFEKACRERGILHRLTEPKSPATNGMVERFNRMVKEGAVKTRRFATHEEMENQVELWCGFYNADRRHGGLGRKTPLEEALRWYNQKPELFLKEPTREGVRTFLTYQDCTPNSLFT